MNDQDLTKEGLNPRTIATHLRRVQQSLAKDVAPSFTIEDTCRLDNGGIVRFDNTPAVSDSISIAAFIPAAGAATRYTKVLIPFIEALQAERIADIEAAASDLIGQGALSWPIPDAVKAILQDPKASTQEIWARALKQINRPKALQPCVTDEVVSFLQMKDIEHRAFAQLQAQVFVTPYKLSEKFAKHLGKTGIKTLYLEQGPSLSTIRIKPNGEPFLENGRPSIVPAGHGALAELFPVVKTQLPGTEAIFIRNIDNVIGTRSYTVKGVQQFLQGFSFVFSRIKDIRQALSKGDIAMADAYAHKLGTAFGLSWNGSWINSIMQDLFHTPCPQGDIDALKKLYGRPLNVLGQVPNLANDVGGTPCFVNHLEKRLKVCLEVPHASERDQQSFLANPAKATHFNPVVVCAELTDSADCYGEEAEDFWLLARKTHGGEPVVYHESVLYELLGNSETSNCLFVEIPRFLFHPRKSLADGKDEKLEGLVQAPPID